MSLNSASRGTRQPGAAGLGTLGPPRRARFTLEAVFIDDQGVAGSAADSAMKGLLESLRGDEASRVSPSDLLPSDTSKFYRYEGSLTTPPYDETVSWTVLKEPIHVAPETLAMLKGEHGHEAREAQDLNRRYILANFQ